MKPPPPPSDDLGGHRHIAFVWHLTGTPWPQTDGGDLVWCSPYARFAPSFNTLYLFQVHRQSYHFVQQVTMSGAACPPRRRLAVNGWYVLDDGVQAERLGERGEAGFAARLRGGDGFFQTWDCSA